MSGFLRYEDICKEFCKCEVNRDYFVAYLKHDTIPIIKKALEKQIPQLVANDGMRIPFSYYCPICREELSDGGYQDEDVKYCPNCGQALRWE